MIVGSGPTAPSAAGLSGYTPPRPQIDYPNGTVAYLDATSSASTTPPSPTTPSAPATATAGSLAASPTVSFPHNLQFWDQGADILMLQQFLNTHGFIIATNGPGSEGSETNFFGPHTYRALIKFQSANNLPATGYFGPLTRALINSQIQ